MDDPHMTSRKSNMKEKTKVGGNPAKTKLFLKTSLLLSFLSFCVLIAFRVQK